MSKSKKDDLWREEMNDFSRHTKDEYWKDIEDWADNESKCSWDACILELRSRVEDLETRNSVSGKMMTDERYDQLCERIALLQVSYFGLKADYLRLANACAKMSDDRVKFF
ncbi:MAG: hypothetical protein ACO24P_05790, partial [Candidatus Nanopelagicaceae bacterium]